MPSGATSTATRGAAGDAARATRAVSDCASQASSAAQRVERGAAARTSPARAPHLEVQVAAVARGPCRRRSRSAGRSRTRSPSVDERRVAQVHVHVVHVGARAVDHDVVAGARLELLELARTPPRAATIGVPHSAKTSWPWCAAAAAERRAAGAEVCAPRIGKRWRRNVKAPGRLGAAGGGAGAELRRAPPARSRSTPDALVRDAERVARRRAARGRRAVPSHGDRLRRRRRDAAGPAGDRPRRRRRARARPRTVARLVRRRRRRAHRARGVEEDLAAPAPRTRSRGRARAARARRRRARAGEALERVPSASATATAAAGRRRAARARRRSVGWSCAARPTRRRPRRRAEEDDLGDPLQLRPSTRTSAPGAPRRSAPQPRGTRRARCAARARRTAARRRRARPPGHGRART